MELNRWTVLLPKRSVQTVKVERFVCKCACRRLPSNSTDVEVYPVHVFNLRGPKLSVLVTCSRLSTSQLFQHWGLHLKIALKVSLQLGSCLVSRRFLGFSAVVAAPWVTGRTKNKKRRIPFHVVFPCDSVFLKFPIIVTSRLLSKVSKSACVQGRLRRERVTRGEKRSKSTMLPSFQLISLNFPRGRNEKTWLWLAGSNQNDTNTTNQIPCLFSVQVHQTNNDCAQSYCSPFSILGPSSFPFVRLVIYEHLRETGPKTADTVIWEGQVIFE